jgi:hypothetical protein
LYFVQNVVRPVENYIICKKKYNLRIYKMSLPNPEFDINNPDPSGNVFVGDVYAFEATGGFSMERGFDTIKLAEQTAPVHVDVTDAVQIMMDVATFNTKLDLASFDSVTDSFGVNEISLSSEELTAGVTAESQIISVGKYSTLYSDFQTYVASYFGLAGGFSSLFTAASEFAIDTDNTFTAASFIALLTASAQDPSGRYISDLSGSITIGNISKLLKYSVDGNVFGNRDPEIQNWGVGNGFVAGDLIWVPAGTTITLKLAIDPEALAPLNNLSASQSTTVGEGNFTETTEATTELITRVATAPLLIKLVTV